MKQRRVEADIDLEIDGQPAKFIGTGRHMRLEVADASTLRTLSQVSLPNFQRAGTSFSTFDVPALLSAEGLTLEIADRQGSLLVLGEEARGKGYSVPGVGRIDDVTLSSKRAALRLAAPSGSSSWVWALLGAGLILLGLIFVMRQRDEV